MRAEDVQAIKGFQAAVDRVHRQFREGDAFFRGTSKRLQQLAANPRLLLNSASPTTLITAGVVTGLAVAGIGFGAVALAKRRGWRERVTTPAENQSQQPSAIGR